MISGAPERVLLLDRLVARWEVSWAGVMPSGFTLMTICAVSIGSLVLTLFAGKPGARCALVVFALWTVFAVLDQARSLWTLRHPYASPRWRVGSVPWSATTLSMGPFRDEIMIEDWTALLAHADAINFFTRPEPAPASSEARILHLRITSGDRSRELAINDPFEAPELAMLIRLTRRALRDRQVLTPETMTDDQFARLEAALRDYLVEHPDDDRSTESM